MAKAQAADVSDAPAKDTVNLLTLLVAGTKSIDLATVERPDEAGERPDEVVLLGVATDEMKRVFAFHQNLIAEVQELVQEGEQITKDLLGPNFRKARRGGMLEIGAQWFIGMMDGNSDRREKAERLLVIESELHTRKPLVELADKIFWAEAHRSFPAAKGYPVVTLYNDWSIGGQEKNSDDDSERLKKALFGNDGPLGDLGRTPDSDDDSLSRAIRELAGRHGGRLWP